MPTYLYEILTSTGTGPNGEPAGQPTGETFEIVQSMKDATLTKHPETGKPCRRAIVAPAVAGKWSPVKEKNTLSNKNLERMGFTKYERKGNGYMERVAGKDGPQELRAD